jgi:hypothetical protein
MNHLIWGLGHPIVALTVATTATLATSADVAGQVTSIVGLLTSVVALASAVLTLIGLARRRRLMNRYRKAAEIREKEGES